jgi:hypothetical protein
LTKLMAAGLSQTGFAKNDPEEVAMNRIRRGEAVTPAISRSQTAGFTGSGQETTLVKEAS